MLRKFARVLRFTPLLVLALLLFTPLVVFAASPENQAVIPFFDGYSPQEAFLFLVGGVIGFTQGLWPNVSLLNLVKKWLKVQDVAAGWIILAFSSLLSVLALYLVGGFAGIDYSADTLMGLAFSLYTMSQMGYQSFKKAQEKNEILPTPAG